MSGLKEKYYFIIGRECMVGVIMNELVMG